MTGIRLALTARPRSGQHHGLEVVGLAVGDAAQATCALQVSRDQVQRAVEELQGRGLLGQGRQRLDGPYGLDRGVAGAGAVQQRDRGEPRLRGWPAGPDQRVTPAFGSLAVDQNREGFG